LSAAPKPDVWTIREVLGWTAQHFDKRGVDAPRLTAEVLVAHSLATTRVRLYTDFDRPLTSPELAAYRKLIERRVAGEPTQYLTGQKEFYNRSFQVDARVLIPRPETELLSEIALRELPPEKPAQVLDLCTGSGCIAITLAAERLLSTVWATDVSPDACAVARQNAEAHGVLGRLTLAEGDLFEPLPAGTRFDLLVSNPPYIRSDEIASLASHVQREPRLALDGGADGLDVVRRIISDAALWLVPGGLLALEISETQGSAVLSLLQSAGLLEARIEKDLERRDRFALARARKA
jgi:release factor glutamine methyltransferase